MKKWMLLVALMAAGPAFAIPPISPKPADEALSREYERATQSNDFPAYVSLFAEDAKIVNEAGFVFDREQWLKRAASTFSSNRKTRFLSSFAGYAPIPGKAVRRFMFLMETRDCPPSVAECFPRWRTEIITVQEGKIIELQASSEFSYRLTKEGVWTIYD